LLENFPTESAQGVTAVDGDDGEGEKKKIGVTQDVEKLCAAKIAEMKEAARAVSDKSQDTEPNKRD
jgi:hypothetical protein